MTGVADLLHITRCFDMMKTRRKPRPKSLTLGTPSTAASIEDASSHNTDAASDAETSASPDCVFAEDLDANTDDVID
eukprot:11141598-Karenia_brevis.AAC.1